MKRLKKIVNKSFDLLEIYIPMLTFFMMFVLYIIMIVLRYISYGKLGKYFELCQISFIWCSILSASYGGRSGKHVVFGIIYDKCSKKTQLIMRLIGDVIIAVAFVTILPYAYEAIDFLKIKKSDLLRIPFNIIYAPFIVFLGLTAIHYVNGFIKDVKGLMNGKRGMEES